MMMLLQTLATLAAAAQAAAAGSSCLVVLDAAGQDVKIECAPAPSVSPPGVPLRRLCAVLTP